jgi:hypothetical protein
MLKEQYPTSTIYTNYCNPSPNKIIIITIKENDKRNDENSSNIQYNKKKKKHSVTFANVLVFLFLSQSYQIWIKTLVITT